MDQNPEEAGTLSQEEVASRQEWVVSSWCLRMMDHVCGGSHSKATSLFTGANEASAVTTSQSLHVVAEEEARSLSYKKKKKKQRELEVAFSIICHKEGQHLTYYVRMGDPVENCHRAVPQSPWGLLSSCS